MRNYTKLFKKVRIKSLLLLSITAFLAFSSCKKDEEGPVRYSNIAFIHAIPDAGPLDIYIDEKTSANKNIGFGVSTEYHQITAGAHKVTATEANSIVEKINVNHSFDADKNFSVIAFNTNAQPQSVIIPDTVGVPPSGKVWVRYVNLSPTENDKSYVIRIEGSTAIFEFGDRLFKTGSSYKEYDAGTYAFNAVDVKSSSSTPVATTPSTSFTGGKIYTLVLTGKATGNPSLGLTVIQQ